MFPVFKKETYRWKRPIRNVKYFFKDCKNSMQRIKRGYSNEDAAEFCGWFRGVIPDILREYRRQLDAFPSFPATLSWEFYKEHEQEITVSYETFVSVTSDSTIQAWRKRMEEECRNKWKNTVDEMIFLFSESDEETCQKQNPYDQDQSLRFIQEQDKYWEIEQQLTEYRGECLRKAFELLSKWLEDLWI